MLLLTMQEQFLEFLHHELAISDAAIAVVLRHRQPSLTQFPILLWQNGLVTLQQLDQIFDWLESQSIPRAQVQAPLIKPEHPLAS